jgi:hypothetical protein
VLLYLSPGLDQQDIEEADTQEAQERYAECRGGRQSLWPQEIHKYNWKWWSGRTRNFGPLEELREKIAFLNISAYHSASFKNYNVLTALQSCRTTIEWAQTVLFPQAEHGARVVVCMRAAAAWGLRQRTRYGESLFVPSTNMAGHMLTSGDHGILREQIIDRVKAALA